MLKVSEMLYKRWVTTILDSEGKWRELVSVNMISLTQKGIKLSKAG